MEGNHTQTEFILLGITDSPLAQTPLFVLFLLIYIVTLVGNFGIIILVRVSPSLHTPMYFFLTHFAFTDICYSTVISPRMLADLLSEDKTISFLGCMMQFLMFAFFAISECHLLAMMAYDRHVAICQPLLYVTIISSRVCWQLVASSYLFAFPSAIIFTWCVFGGSFCGPNRIDHFFCDVVPVLKLVCSDMHNSEMVIFAFVTINVVGTSVVILLSYISILCTVLRMCSAQSRVRVFHTCASHLTAVSIYFGSAFFMYLQPSSSHRSLDKVASIFYAVVTPMLNPFIYSLRNKEVKGALKKLVGIKVSSSSFEYQGESLPRLQLHKRFRFKEGNFTPMLNPFIYSLRNKEVKRALVE
ncbi:olfactory receptor 1020-like [Pezoporus wallicus]|uniref:olfactory receptor 1020-like n=1 Tax=Pezoporus wallicus TaxID=35540 RepID=UPI00254DC13B|nr:olfactory receptor 1020-like [Pezoporus wallicus]